MEDKDKAQELLEEYNGWAQIAELEKCPITNPQETLLKTR
jgi:hypothetical protein